MEWMKFPKILHQEWIDKRMSFLVGYVDIA